MKSLRPRLLLPLLLAATAFTLTGRAAPEKWTADIEKFTQADQTNPPPRDAVLFVGSSSIRFWTTLDTDFPGIPCINRGFGGSLLGDSAFYADRIIIPYHPRLIVVYAGENDLAIGRSAENVLADFRTLRTKVHAALPATKILFLAVKESPSRAKIRAQVLLTNELIRKDCAGEPYCTFVDLATPLLDSSGKTRAELFRGDRLHLNPDGYAVWVKTLSPYLKP